MANQHFTSQLLAEDISPSGRRTLNDWGMNQIDSVRSGDYELFLLEDPRMSGGFQLALQRDGMEVTSFTAQNGPGQPLTSPVSYRLFRDTILRWNAEHTRTIYIASMNPEKTKAYYRFLKILRIPFDVQSPYLRILK